MTDRDKLREAVAEKLFERGRAAHDAPTWTSAPDEMKDWIRGHADAILDLILPSRERSVEGT